MGPLPVSASEIVSRVMPAPDATPDPVSERIRHLMELRGWSARQLSIRAGLTESHVTLLLRRGASKAEAATLGKIAAAGDVALEWLLSGDGAMAEAAPAPRVESSGDPKFEDIPGYAESLPVAKRLRPEHPEYIWQTLSAAGPLLTGPITPAMLADLADVLLKYTVPPRVDKERPSND